MHRKIPGAREIQAEDHKTFTIGFTGRRKMKGNLVAELIHSKKVKYATFHLTEVLRGKHKGQYIIHATSAGKNMVLDIVGHKHTTKQFVDAEKFTGADRQYWRLEGTTEETTIASYDGKWCLTRFEEMTNVIH